MGRIREEATASPASIV